MRSRRATAVSRSDVNPNELIATLPVILAVTEYVEASVVASCLRAIARLKVPDAIADGAPSLAELAATVGAEASGLGRVLRLLEAHEFFLLDEGHVQLTARGRLLRSDVSPSLWSMFVAPGYADADHHLEHTLRTGEAAFTKAQQVGFWDYLRANEGEARLFDENMRKQGELLNLSALVQLQIAGSTTVVDVGGGTGSLLCAVLAAHPQVRGVLVDRPDVIERARAVVRGAGLTDRCSLVAGELKGPIPAGDCYLLARILHDWSDDECKLILSAIRRAAAPSAVLNILEMVVPPGRGRDVSKYSDITMLGLFEGGRERSQEEFAELLRGTGWVLEKMVPPPIDVIPTKVLVARAVPLSEG